MNYQLHHGDCLEVLKTMADNSVDSIVTDPPYGLSFMGKKWDYDVPSEDVWRECLRVLKPGGHLLAFAGTRTQHRMAVRIEDAGFEIRDMIAWVYGSGFPKSLDVSKALDKVNGESGRLHKFTAYMRTTGLTAKQINDTTGTFMGSHYLTDKSQPAIPTCALWSKLRPLCGEVPAWVDELVQRIEAEREVVGVKTMTDTSVARPAIACSAQGLESAPRRDVDITAPATKAARQWQGWGTALKPALEPITVARKPLIGTVAENVLEHGTGAINVDGCRVECKDKAKFPAGTISDTEAVFGGGAGRYASRARTDDGSPNGRWPANLIHDGSDEVVGLFPVTGASKATPRNNGDFKSVAKGRDLPHVTYGHDDNGGSAARFFYCAKASKKDRDEGCEHLPEHQEGLQLPRGKCPDCGTWKNAGEEQCKCGGKWEMTSNPPPKARNNHPTVKPTALMRYLCRLVTPPEGIVLDPFMGSGSTGKAAVMEGFQFIGIEREAEYLQIAKARIEREPAQKQLL